MIIFVLQKQNGSTKRLSYLLEATQAELGFEPRQTDFKDYALTHHAQQTLERNGWQKEKGIT